MSSLETLREDVAGLLEGVLLIRVPSYRSDLVESGLIDSLGITTLLSELEDRFAITVEFEDLDLAHFRTVDDIAAFVIDKRA